MSTATAPAVGAEEWISRADAAELARRSEDAIKRDQKDHGLEARSGPNGKTMLRLADLVRIGRIRPQDLPAGASPAETAELRRTQDQLVAVQRELGEARGRLAGGCGRLTSSCRSRSRCSDRSASAAPAGTPSVACSARGPRSPPCTPPPRATGNR
jgi:hypothetical protein